MVEIGPNLSEAIQAVAKCAVIAAFFIAAFWGLTRG